MTAEIRELLELAAAAVVVEVERIDCHLYIKGTTVCWNPLESGDDLIELIDRLMMNINRWKDGVSAYIDEPYEGKEMLELYADHPTRKAALAMAVLRCAAEIGRRM